MASPSRLTRVISRFRSSLDSRDSLEPDLPCTKPVNEKSSRLPPALANHIGRVIRARGRITYKSVPSPKWTQEQTCRWIAACTKHHYRQLAWAEAAMLAHQYLEHGEALFEMEREDFERVFGSDAGERLWKKLPIS